MADNDRTPSTSQFMDTDPEAENKVSGYVVDLLNKASLMQKDGEKVLNLKKVQELIVHKDPTLLDNFLDEMLAFQTDRALEARKFVVSFIEEASKKDPDILPRVVGNLTMMLQDDNVQVAKKVILCMGQVYRIALRWVATAKSINSDMKQTWQYIQQLKSKVAEMLDVHNEGVRFHTIKFIECIVTALSWRTADTELPKGMVNDSSLDLVPENNSLLKIKKLEEEGKQAFETLVKYQASKDITSTNLMTCMSSLVQIARMRPGFMLRVIQSLEALHVNLPPSLAKSQVSSIRKNLKMQLLYLLKHPASVSQHANLTTLLTDLGATQAEVLKALPKDDRKRKANSRPDSSQTFKKPKSQPEPDQTPLRDDEEDYLMTPYTGLGSKDKKQKKPVPVPPEKKKTSAIDITTEDLVPRLTAQNVADLVLLSMVMLPDQMPASFQATYTPIAAAGTSAQIKHLARLLATQLTASGLGKGAAEQKLTAKEDDEDNDDDDVETGTSPKHTIQTVVGGSVAGQEDEPVAPMPPPAGVPTRKPGIPIRAFKLSAVTKPMSNSEVAAQAQNAFKRILKLEKQSHLGNMSPARTKILVTLVTQFGGPLKDELETFIFDDLRSREDLILMWIYQEYANAQGYNMTSMQAGPLQDKLNMDSYDQVLTRLLTGVLNRPDQKEGLFSRLVLESPSITTNAIQILKKYCQEEGRISLGMTTLKELVIKRPCMQLEFLDVLLDFTSHEKPEVRNAAIRATKKLHERKDLKDPIERYALYHLKLLLQSTPPGELFGPGKGRMEATYTWSEDTIKLCLYLYLGLLPVNHKLVHELANVYTATTADIKRTILRVLEGPVKGMGMQSPELLTLLENCPKGAETLITRIIHILTDKAVPSPELVERVRELYHKRVSDVRFLIPVLTGLSKKEVVAALPKLIKLNPVVVKEVFNRLLGAQEVEGNYQSPLTPAELLISLHTMDPLKLDMKTAIKATNLCFAEKSIYTQDVLMKVIQHLVDLTPLPTLLMRTVLQSLAMFPKLIGLVLSILQKLVTKQVWKQKKVWEGFVKCCQRTKPHCYGVLLQLPPPQLKSTFEIAPDLRGPLHKHVQSFTPHQRAHIPKAIIQILEKEPEIKAEKTEDMDRLALQDKVFQAEEQEKHLDKVHIRIEHNKAEKVMEQQNQNPIKEEAMDTTEVKSEPVNR